MLNASFKILKRLSIILEIIKKKIIKFINLAKLLIFATTTNDSSINRSIDRSIDRSIKIYEKKKKIQTKVFALNLIAKFNTHAHAHEHAKNIVVFFFFK